MGLYRLSGGLQVGLRGVSEMQVFLNVSRGLKKIFWLSNELLRDLMEIS